MAQALKSPFLRPTTKLFVKMQFNTVKTTMLMALLTALVIGVFWYAGGEQYGYFGLLVGLALNLVMFWFSDRIVLAMVRAKEADRNVYSGLYGIVERLAFKARIPKPKVYVVENPALNAFATGRSPSHAAVVVYTGLLKQMSEQEIEGVIGHELTHVKNRDTLISTLAAVIAGSLSYLMYGFMYGGRDRDNRNPFGLLAVILAPMAAMLIQLAISRSREYAADEGGAKLSSPLSLASALEKIEASVKRRPLLGGNPSTAHMYIVNPFTSESVTGLFSTHPPVKERVMRLRGMR
jgi:heat shock protein HtpX